MESTKHLKLFERKNGTVMIHLYGTKYVITTTQRLRADLVWSTESVRPTIDDAMKLFDAHKECILSHGHCTGDKIHLR